MLKLWDLTTKGVGGQATKLPFWDEHGLDAKRFTNIMCLLYGSDPPRFKDIVQQLGMPEDRRDRCVADYPARDEAWSRLLAPHVAPETGAPPGSGKLTVQYGAAGSAFSQAVAADLQRLQVFEKLAEAIGTYLVLPNDIRIVHRDCGEPNAFWSPDDRSITMCYELVALMRELFTAPPQGQEGAAPAPPPAAEEQPIRPEPDLTSIETLFGAWQGTFSDPSTGAPVYVDLVLSPDGRFSQLSRVPATGFALHLWGRYQVFQGMIRYVYEGYEPRQYCGPTGYCSPIILPSGESVQIKLADRNTMVANGTYFHRVQ